LSRDEEMYQVQGVESTEEKKMFGQLVWGKKIWTRRAARNFQNAKTGELPSTLPRVSCRRLLPFVFCTIYGEMYLFAVF
jgi:hypothetical protein